MIKYVVYEKPIFRNNYHMPGPMFVYIEGNLRYCENNKKWLLFKEQFEIGQLIL